MATSRTHRDLGAKLARIHRQAFYPQLKRDRSEIQLLCFYHSTELSVLGYCRNPSLLSELVRFLFESITTSIYLPARTCRSKPDSKRNARQEPHAGCRQEFVPLPSSHLLRRLNKRHHATPCWLTLLVPITTTGNQVPPAGNIYANEVLLP